MARLTVRCAVLLLLLRADAALSQLLWEPDKQMLREHGVRVAILDRTNGDVTERKFFVYDRRGNILSSGPDSTGESARTAIWRRDGDGRVIWFRSRSDTVVSAHTRTDSGHVISFNINRDGSRHYTYEEVPFGNSGALKELRFLTAEGRVKSRTIWFYDADSNPVRSEYRIADIVTRSRLEREFMAKGRPSRETRVFNDTVADRTEFLYDAVGRLKVKKATRGDGTPIYREEYSHDERGLVTEVVTFNEDGAVSRRARISYTFY